MLLLYSKFWTLSKFRNVNKSIGDVIAAVEDPKKGSGMLIGSTVMQIGGALFSIVSPVYDRQTDH